MLTIILAAGQGTRLKPHTDQLPKAMVTLNGIPLLMHQKRVLNAVGINQINVVTGYKEECINISGITKYHNHLYATTNMVASLYVAKDLFTGESDIIISYGDIVFEEKVITSLINSGDNLSVVVDKSWFSLWQHRMPNVLDDAETMKIDEEKNIIEIGNKPQ